MARFSRATRRNVTWKQGGLGSRRAPAPFFRLPQASFCLAFQQILASRVTIRNYDLCESAQSAAKLSDSQPGGLIAQDGLRQAIIISRLGIADFRLRRL